MKSVNRFIKLFIISALYLIATSFPAFGQPDEDKQFLLMYFKEEELVVKAPTRSSKPVSKTAENVTVITAREIELMNAHTVADVLNTVTGIQTFGGGGFGSVSLGLIQGSDPRQVAVFIDGIPLNNLSDNVVDLGSIQVQNIEKIEIVKGPASSAWGSALGGVINIITKSTRKRDGFGGTVSASYGEKNAGDFRAEASGKQQSFGYYLNAGRLQTDGLTPHFDVSNNNAYVKMSYDITEQTDVQFTLGYSKGSRGDGVYEPGDLSFADEFSNLRSSLAFKTAINKDIDVRFLFWRNRQRLDQSTSQLSTGNFLSEDNYTDKGYGENAEMNWRNHIHNLVFGLDHESKTLDSNRISGGEQAIRKSAIYLNDTISLGKLSITPGIRHDETSTNDDFTSPSLGMTYKVSGKTVLRAYTARGFNIPPLIFTYGDNAFITPNPDLKMERILSYQVGAETAALKYFWAKISGFRHEIRDAISTENISGPYVEAVNGGRQRRQGLEAEVKTLPVYNTSFSAGAEYIDAKDLTTGAIIKNNPRYIYDLGLLYDNQTSLRASLKGRYIDWNTDSLLNGTPGKFIFDLTIVGVISQTRTHSIEALAAIHNLFNGSQYPAPAYANPARWIEAGLRFKF